MSEDFVISAWEFTQECYRIADTEEERERANRTAKAIYERAVCDFGFKWVLENLEPLPLEEVKL